MFLSVMKMISDIKYWFRSLFKVWVNEYKLVGKDLGVMLFFYYSDEEFETLLSIHHKADRTDV